MQIRIDYYQNRRGMEIDHQLSSCKLTTLGHQNDRTLPCNHHLVEFANMHDVDPVASLQNKKTTGQYQ